MLPILLSIYKPSDGLNMGKTGRHFSVYNE